MNEIELFFKTAESEIRRKHIVYLKGEKCLPDGIPPEEVIRAEELQRYNKKPFGFILFWVKKTKFIKRQKLIKRYNKGIETALKVLQREYRRFNKRLEREELNA